MVMGQLAQPIHLANLKALVNKEEVVALRGESTRYVTRLERMALGGGKFTFLAASRPVVCDNRSKASARCVGPGVPPSAVAIQ